MKTEEILFDIYSEFMIFAELYETLSSHQVVTFIENVTASFCPRGHDPWVIGEEPAVVVDFQGMIDYARRGGGSPVSAGNGSPDPAREPRRG